MNNLRNFIKSTVNTVNITPQFYAFCYDNIEKISNITQSSIVRKIVLEFIIRNDGLPTKCPLKSTINFTSYLNHNDWVKLCNYSDHTHLLYGIVRQVTTKDNDVTESEMYRNISNEYHIGFIKDVEEVIEAIRIDKTFYNYGKPI